MIWIALAIFASALVAIFMLRKVAAADWRALGATCLKSEGIKFFAFCGATGAGMALTVYLIWNTAYLHEHQQDQPVFYLAAGSMALLGLTQLSLHRLLGAKQAIEIEFWKLKAKLSQGDDLPPTTTEQKTTTLTETTAKTVTKPKPAEPAPPSEEPFDPGGAP